ncbi:MAG: hypothetical protein KGL39_49495, partial [Patescibacteria group bacterium]|nr:hypothetical protein [Patescibacteria group bacterium]
TGGPTSWLWVDGQTRSECWDGHGRHEPGTTTNVSGPGGYGPPGTAETLSMRFTSASRSLENRGPSRRCSTRRATSLELTPPSAA